MGERINAHLENIEAASVGAGPHRRADWRASSFILSASAPDRFASTGGQPTAPPPPPPVLDARVVSVLLEAAYRCAPKPEPAVRIVDAVEVAQLVETTEPPPPMPKQKAPPLLPE